MVDPSQTCGIYGIVNHWLSRVYLGHASTVFTKRWTQHKDDLTYGRHHNIDMQQDWIELGSGAFDFVIIEPFPKNIAYIHSLRALERRYIATSECWLYNATKDRYHGRTDDYLIGFLYQ